MTPDAKNEKQQALAQQSQAAHLPLSTGNGQTRRDTPRGPAPADRGIHSTVLRRLTSLRTGGQMPWAGLVAAESVRA